MLSSSSSRPHSRLVLLSHVVHLFLVCLHVVPLLSCVFHCVISCFVSPVCCCPHQVELMSVSSCFVLVMSPSLSSRFTSLSCPRSLLSSVVLLLSHHHHHCPVMSPLSSRLFHVLCRGLCPLVSSLLLCFVSSSPVCLLSLFCPSSCRPVTV